MELERQEKAKRGKEKAKRGKEKAMGRKENAKGGKENAKVGKENVKGRKESSPTKGRKVSSPIEERKRYNVPKGCNICLSREHLPISCRYRYVYPAGAPVGRFARIICLCCGKENPHPGEPGIDWEARADLKPSYSYPSIEEELMELNLASTSESAVDGTAKEKIRGKARDGGNAFASRSPPEYDFY